MENFKYKLTAKNKEYCSTHAQKMVEGFSTYSFKHGKVQSFDVYNIGKIGEFAFFKFLDELKTNGILKIKHVPFRASYEKNEYKDDYIVEINGENMYIEVKTKGRGVDPKPNYECCTDSIKPHFVYVFVSYNKKTDVASVVGCANWDNLSKHAKVTKKGSKNNNFENKVNEFNIKIEHLYNIQEIINLGD